MSDKKKSWSLSIATAILGILITTAVAYNSERSAREQERIEFTAISDLMNLQLQKRLQRFEVGLHNFEGLFLASKSVEYSEFSRMFSAIDLQHSYPGSLGIGFITPVRNTPEDLQEFRAELLSQGAPDFEIHSVPEKNRVSESAPAPETLFVVKFIEPIQTNIGTLGMDIASDAARHFAAQQAQETGLAKLTKRLKLVQSQHAESGFLYLLPVYKPKPDLSDEEDFLGWVFMPVVIQHAVDGIEQNINGEVSFEIFEGKQSSPEKLICRGNNLPSATRTGLSRTYQIDVGGQPWLLQTKPSVNYAEKHASSTLTLFMIGVVLSLGCAWVVKRLSSQASMAEATAREMTAAVRRLALVAKRTTNAVVIADTNRRIIWTNDAFTQLTGYSAEEAIGQVPGRLLQSPNTDLAIVNEIRSALSSGQGFCGEILNRDKYGEDYWVSVDIQPMHDEDGTHVGYMAIELDITETKLAAAKLSKETQRTILALDSGGLAIWDWDLVSDRLIVDDRWERIIGPYDYEAGQYNKYWEDRIHPEDLAGYQEVVQKGYSQNVIQGEWRYRNSEDEYTWVEVRGHVVARNDENIPTKMVGTITEITDRKMAEEALRASEARAKAMFDRSSEAIFLFNEKNFIDCNPTTLKLFGFETKEELLTQHPADLSPPHQPDGTPKEVAAKQKIDQVLRDGFAKFEWIHQKSSGETFFSDVSLTLIDRENFTAMGIIRDISERRELERKLAQAQKLESIGQLAAGVAHEINTPMQCVFSNIEYLEQAFDRVFNLTETYRQLDRGQWTPETVELIEKLERKSKFDRVKGNIADATTESGEAARRVIEIVRAMKTMSHPGTTDHVSTDLNKLVQDAAVISRNRWKYVSALETHLDKEVQGIPLLPAQLSQVMLNLIVNSADAIVEKLGREPVELGKINISTRRDNGGVIIEVSDTGNGIPEHVRKRIFDPFFTTKDVGTGTGQGLAIAYDVIVNQHHGKIDVDSTVGQGTRFIIWLPDSISDRTTAVDQHPEPVHAGGIE